MAEIPAEPILDRRTKGGAGSLPHTIKYADISTIKYRWSGDTLQLTVPLKPENWFNAKRISVARNNSGDLFLYIVDKKFALKPNGGEL